MAMASMASMLHLKMLKMLSNIAYLLWGYIIEVLIFQCLKIGKERSISILSRTHLNKANIWVDF